MWVAACPLPVPITVSQMADDARAVLDGLGMESAHVIGHSLGGLVALQLALDARPRVRSLSLLCTFASGASGGAAHPAHDLARSPLPRRARGE